MNGRKRASPGLLRQARPEGGQGRESRRAGREKVRAERGKQGPHLGWF